MRRAFAADRPGVLQGARSYLLQDDDGQIALTHSVSAGLDYALVGPEHALAARSAGARNTAACSDDDALDAALTAVAAPKASFRRSNRRMRWRKRSAARPRAKGKMFVVNLSGRGDKDIDIYRENLKELDRGMTRIGSLFESLKREQPLRHDRLPHGRRSVARSARPPGGGAGARRRGPDRTGRSVFRSRSPMVR